MREIKEGDWVELDFVGKVKRTGQIFDLTKEDIAKKEGLYQDNQEYKSLKVRIGSRHLLEGLDIFLLGKKIESNYTVDLKPEKAFGKRNPKLIQLTSLSKLKKKGINPVPGMPLNIDGAMATVRSISGGRVIIDFNHPLSGKELSYEVWVKKKIEKDEDKVKALLSFMSLPESEFSLKKNEEGYKLKLKQNISGIKELLEKQIKEQVPGIKLKIVTKENKTSKTSKDN